MKLIFAVVNNDDVSKLVKELTAGGFTVTNFATTGGFLRTGNTTLLIGLENHEVEEVIELIREHSNTRKKKVTREMPKELAAVAIASQNSHKEIIVGGATLFIIEVEQFKKV